MAAKMQGGNVWVLESPGDYIIQPMKVKVMYWVGSENPERGEIVDGDTIEVYQVQDYQYYDAQNRLITEKRANLNAPIWRRKAVATIVDLEFIIDSWVKSIYVQTMDHGELHIVIG